MNELTLNLTQTQFKPGDTVSGRLRWSTSVQPKSVSIYIGWYTEGRGTEDSHVEFEQKFATEFTAGEERFDFILPPSPYSFQGKLIELIWYVSAETEKGGHYQRQLIEVGPDAHAVKIA